MLKSAEYFLAGFFGLQWTNNASLEVIIEMDGFNNSLAGYDQCNNSNTEVSAGGANATAMWQKIYLQNATSRLASLAGDYNWTLSDTYNAQTLCPVRRDSALVLRRLIYSSTKLLRLATQPSAICSPSRNGKASNIHWTSASLEAANFNRQRAAL